MSEPFISQKLLDDVRGELTGTYANSGIEDHQPSPEDVIRSALIEVATQLRLDADEQSGCDKVDECEAGALVRYRLADWLTVSIRADYEYAMALGLRDGRYCPYHDIDLVPPDRTLGTRRYCPQCPAGSTLGFPRWMGEDEREIES